jgi:hypothetical protein
MRNELTRRYFLNQLLELRSLMGSREFWAGSQERRDAAILAFGFVYTNAADLLPEDLSAFEATIQEYHRRESSTIALG